MKLVLIYMFIHLIRSDSLLNNSYRSERFSSVLSLDNEQYSICRKLTLCFCHSINRKFFLSSLALTHCLSTSSSWICHENRFVPIINRLEEFFPSLIDHPHCLNKTSCLHPLESTEWCDQCSYSVQSLNINKTCFDLCQTDRTCSFVCIHGLIIACDRCLTMKTSIICRCLDDVKLVQSCSSTSETTTARWMQKKGFPAAGILALLVGATFLLTLIIKQIYRQIDIIVRRRNGSVRSSVIPNCHEPRSRIRSCTMCSVKEEEPMIGKRLPMRDLLENQIVENVRIDHHHHGGFIKGR